MKNYIKKIIFIIALLSVTQVGFAADELGEFCFSGAFENTGRCIISIEATQHGKYFSLNGFSDCDVIDHDLWFRDIYSGIAFGSGYIKDGRYFHAALRISSSTNNSATTPNAIVLFEYDLQTSAVKFKASTDTDDNILEYDFSLVSCQ